MEKPFSRNYVHFFSLSLSLCREIIDINIPCDSISKIYIFPVIYAINLVLILIWHSVMVADDILATKFCARDIFDSFFFPCIYQRIIDMKRISRLYIVFILLN